MEAPEKIIDIHTHIYPDDIAGLVLGRYKSRIDVFCEGTRASTVVAEAEAGISQFVILPVATTPHCAESNAFAKESAVGPVLAFGTIHPGTPEPEREIALLAKSGILGIKVHPQFQSTDVDADAYLSIFSAAAKNGLPVLFHAGLDPIIPGACRAAPEAIARMLDKAERIPDLVLIAAHLGGMDLFDDVEKYVVGRNIYLDTALVADRISQEQYRRIIKSHGAHRILFGSDCPWQHPRTALAGLKALALPPEEERAILYGNTAALLGLD